MREMFWVSKTLRSESRKIIGLINNAKHNPSVNKKGLENEGSMEEFDLNTWDIELNVGLRAFICTKIFGQMMVKINMGPL